MAYLVNLDLRDRTAVVVGAGSVALRKVRVLLEAGASVTVIAPAACEELRSLAARGRLQLAARPYAEGDAAGAFVVIAATDDEAVNARVSEEARALGILVNVVDRPALCTFTLPAVVRRGDLRLAVATEGRCPALAASIRRELEARFGPAYGELTALMGRVRDGLMAEGWAPARVRDALTALYGRGLAGLLSGGRSAEAAALLRDVLGEDLAERISGSNPGG